MLIGTEDRESQVLSMRAAVAETFPEPNRRLLQRYALPKLLSRKLRIITLDVTSIRIVLISDVEDS